MENGKLASSYTTEENTAPLLLVAINSEASWFRLAWIVSHKTCVTDLGTCHSHLRATGTSVGWPTLCHTLRPLSMGSALAGFVHTPPPGQRRQWLLNWLDWRKQKTDVEKKKAKHPRRLDLARAQSWLCQPLYRSPMGPSLTEQKFQGKIVKKFKNSALENILVPCSPLF